jgi:hypothetical protein
MQAGSGISHEEETVGEYNDFFQIWFDPGVQKTLHHEPTYNEYQHEDFRIVKQDGASVKTILGKESPIFLQSEVTMKDISIEEGHTFQYTLNQNKTLALVVISGKGILFDTLTGTKHYVSKKGFALIHAIQTGEISLQAESPFRLAALEVPAQVDYSLYRNR